MKSPFSFSMCLVSKILVSNMFFGIVSRVLVPSAAALLPIAVSFAQTEFNGTYAGTVCGDGKETGLTFPLTLTVANGVVSSTINGLPSGTVSATG
ncbi:MAG: hypothetical protein Q8P51_10500, partial [Ignavibacteria bacterium]|nr:hypothetical protein [Ignavibacteria bacterium]